MGEEPDEMVTAVEQWLLENPPLTNAALKSQVARLQAELEQARKEAADFVALARHDEWDEGLATAIEARARKSPKPIL